MSKIDETNSQITEYDYSNAQSGKWLALITGFDDVAYKIRTAPIPSITLGTTNIGGTSNVELEVSGDTLTFDDLTFDFYIDSTFRNYLKLFNWIKENSKRDDDLVADITLMLLDNNGKPQGVDILYKNCYPISLASVILDTENTTSDLFTNITFKFDDFGFVDGEFEVI